MALAVPASYSNFYMNALEQLRAGQLTGSKRFQLASGETEFPREIFDLADSLEFLDLSNNNLRSLPDDFSQLQQLKIAFFNNNQFESFPQVLAQCPQLSMVSFKGNQLTAIAPDALSPNFRWLILTNNQLTELPRSIGQLSKLQKLMLAGNQLRSLPPELAQCHSLELIRIAANQLTELPAFLLQLPRLAWIAYAGNPFSQAGSAPETHLPIVDQATLEVGDILGQGASGIIYQGNWTTSAHEPPKAVAIKKFKGEITSDGSPLDEMRACIAAGSHPNLVSVLAKLDPEADSDSQAGLLFDLLAQDYQNLGGPPSLDSCTRDTYSNDTRFTPNQILTIAQGIASVITHLHQRGILHGDLYAHNILINPTGHSILGDFGAASFYDPADQPTAQALTQIEARAYGCLLEDLLDHQTPNTGDSTTETCITSLRQLQQTCMNPNPALRPRFDAIVQTLSEL